jgi:HTH-type transcriptional regulator/antitoxin HipB
VTEPLAAIGLRVRAARHAAGMQQHELAERIGTSRGTVANLEAGRQDVTISTITKIAAALRVDASHLLGDGPTPARTDKARGAAPDKARHHLSNGFGSYTASSGWALRSSSVRIP